MLSKSKLELINNAVSLAPMLGDRIDAYDTYEELKVRENEREECEYAFDMKIFAKKMEDLKLYSKKHPFIDSDEIVSLVSKAIFAGINDAIKLTFDISSISDDEVYSITKNALTTVKIDFKNELAWFYKDAGYIFNDMASGARELEHLQNDLITNKFRKYAMNNTIDIINHRYGILIPIEKEATIQEVILTPNDGVEIPTIKKSKVIAPVINETILFLSKYRQAAIGSLIGVIIGALFG